MERAGVYSTVTATIPRPGAKLTTFDFVSAMSESGPFLIAVTLEV